MNGRLIKFDLYATNDALSIIVFKMPVFLNWREGSSGRL